MSYGESDSVCFGLMQIFARTLWMGSRRGWSMRTISLNGASQLLDLLIRFSTCLLDSICLLNSVLFLIGLCCCGFDGVFRTFGDSFESVSDWIESD